MLGEADGFRAMTDLPEFQQWFRGSKIVDQHGEPLVVWHGLKNPIEHIDGLNKRVLFSPHFSQFDVSKTIEPGAWFSPQASFAQHYGTPAPFFLRVLNPLQDESPITAPPAGHDGVYRMRSSRSDIWDALEIAVFDPTQIRLAFDVTDSNLQAMI